MERTQLGRTELLVSRMGLGGGGPSRLGQQTGGDAKTATELVREAYAAGVNFFDSSEVYGTEKLLGDALRDLPRGDIVLSTKGEPTQDGVLIDSASLVRKVESSLSQLGTETIDLYLLHGLLPDYYDLACEVLVPTLIRLRESGKIRYFGISEAYGRDPDHQMLARAAFDPWWDAFFVGYNALDPTARRLVLPRAAELGIGCVGIFAVSNRLRTLEGARKTAREALERGTLRPGLLDLDDPLAILCEGEEDCANAIEAAYRFALSESGLHSVLVGTGNATHLRDNLRTGQKGSLATERVRTIHAAFGPPRLGGAPIAGASTPGEDDRERYRDVGYLKLPGVIDRETLDAVLADSERLMRRPSLQAEENLRVEYRPNASGEKVLTKLDPSTDLSDRLDALAHDPRILEPVRALIGEEPVLLKDKLIYKPPAHPGFGCHQDFANWTPFSRDALTVFVALDEASLDTGPVEVFPGLHQKGLILAGGEFRPSREWDVPTEMDPMPVPLEPGDLLIFNCLLPHQSGTNRTPNMRRALLLTYSRVSVGDRYSAYYEHYMKLRGGNSSRGPSRYFEPPVRALDEPACAAIVTGQEPSRLDAPPPVPGSHRLLPAPPASLAKPHGRRGLEKIRVWRKLRRRFQRATSRSPQPS